MIDHSSTSNSESKGDRDWPSAWLVGLLVAALLFFGTELLWRSKGHSPSVTDSTNLWSFHRSRVYGSNVLVLLGASRAQLGVDHKVIQKRLPNTRFVNLAVDALHPTAALRDLSLDIEFNGKLIVDITAAAFTWKGMEEARAYPYGYHRVFKKSLVLWLDTIFEAVLQEHAISRQANLRPLRVLQSLLRTRRLPEPYYVRTYSSRMRTADYSLAPQMYELRTGIIRQAIAEGPRRLNSGEFETIARGPVREWVSRLKSRGGEIVFVSFPTQGIQRELDDQLFPRSEFWDRIATLTGARTLHSDDFAGNFHLPDTSHIDGRDQNKFTLELLQALTAAGFL